MYELGFAAQRVFDLGGGTRNCVDCSHRAMKLVCEPFGVGTEAMVCSRFAQVLSGEELTCFEARGDATACGPDAVGFDAIETKKRSRGSRRAVDLESGARPCCDCTFQNEGFGNKVICARFVDPGTGAGMSCQELRKPTGACGESGKGFELRPGAEAAKARRA